VRRAGHIMGGVAMTCFPKKEWVSGFPTPAARKDAEAPS
jgi:hypothetical protein